MQQSIFNPSQIIELLKNIPALWDTVSANEKKGFINELFEKIVVDVPSDYKRGRGNSPTVEIKEFKIR